LVGLPRVGKQAFLLTIAFLIVSSSTAVTGAQTSNYVLQIGAWGDDASKGNLGVRSDIRTHIYDAKSSDFDYFWVGDNLEGGAFIQFGFSYEPGYHCLKGESYQGKLTCSGSSDNIGISDARWQWQYWPNASVNDFYYEIGPANSAGENGTWHTYSVLPNSANGWSFLLDSLQVANTTFQWHRSKDSAYVIAEKVTDSSALGSLGPVEFRNLAYLNEDGWHSVDTLYVSKGCSIYECKIDNPYGISLDGPNHIAAGSGLENRKNGEFLWTSGYVTLDVRVHSNTRVLVASIFGSQVLGGNSAVKLPRGMFVEVSLMDTRVPADGFLGLVGAVDVFQGWTGGVTSTNTTFRMLMVGDKRVQAVWATDYTVPVVGLGLILVIILVAAWIVAKRKRPQIQVRVLYPTSAHSLHFVDQYQRRCCFNCKTYLRLLDRLSVCAPSLDRLLRN
jgi:hypothetical protein